MGVATTTGKGRGGRGARERILQAAEELFYTRGIHATGVAALMKAAHVSPRTFYAHFDSKNLLVAEYLRRLESETRVPAEAALERGDLAPVERLLAIFTPLEADSPAPLRGCPFHNAAVEGAGDLPEIARLVDQHKQAFRDRLSTIAAAAGAARPAVLGRHLALLYEGANALAASSNDPEAFAVAREVAKTLLELALTDVPED